MKCPHCGRDKLTGDLFRVRDRRAVAVTCGGWSSLLGELGSCLPGGDRCCPLRSGGSWPGCGPDVAPSVPSLEGASGQAIASGITIAGAGCSELLGLSEGSSSGAGGRHAPTGWGVAHELPAQ
jgi:hypothetical protein